MMGVRGLRMLKRLSIIRKVGNQSVQRSHVLLHEALQRLVHVQPKVSESPFADLDRLAVVMLLVLLMGSCSLGERMDLGFDTEDALLWSISKDLAHQIESHVVLRSVVSRLQSVVLLLLVLG